MIVNRKTVDPTDAESLPVVQLETAMGAAIEVFEGARALRVPRTRFAPVKTTSDLLVAALGRLRADRRRSDRAGRRPLVRAARDLDAGYYKLLHDFEARFPAGPPSLVGCERLVVAGDVRSARGSSCAGRCGWRARRGWTTARSWRAEGGEFSAPLH